MVERIQKILAQAGHGSRRACEELLKYGRVTVNGKEVVLGDKASHTDDIRVDGRPISKERLVYLILNKPKGVVTSCSDPYNPKTVMGFIDVPQRVYPVGRLDKMSEGMVLLTNDGALTQRLLHPSKGVDKTYRITLDKHVTSQTTKELLDGVRVDGHIVKVKKLSRRGRNELSLTIHEGRKHIVRRLMKTVGYYVLKLTRVSFGPLRLHNLTPGEWRYLKKDELDALKALK
jgi:23S rRNA pseudouridine2605 synthase